ncbi:DEAD/DEAH box helicase [Lichenicoccus sp.]|uniref:DEAD/DEAH box helicase n=1 Tax=Lichenicoccus sp. TaxID=2781899 RepID=UPI003D0D7FE3
MPFPPSHPSLARALAARGYDDPTPVQDAVLQSTAAGRDLLVSAQTGSGKTVAYGLAAADTLLGEMERFERAKAPVALVIAPTRELAMQVHRELSWLYADTGARIVSCIGGMDLRREAQSLAGGCHIVVGTPGRLCDHLTRGRLDISGLKVVVLDEADEMLDLGFRDELETLLDKTPTTRRTLLFSATIAREIASLARRYQHDALRIDTASGNRVQHADIEYRAVLAARDDELHAVVNVLRYFESPTAMVFCNTREMVRHMHGSLLERGFASVALSGELSQSERSRALESLRTSQARVCVATDVAARGLDLPDLGLVVHASLPTDPATLLHRSGRTGRAGRKGTCVVIVPQIRRRRAETLLSAANVNASWSGPPTADEIRTRDSERLLADPVLAEPLEAEDRALAARLLEGRGAEEIAAALIRMHRARLPDPEEIAPAAPIRAHERTPRPANDRPRPERGPSGGGTWFRMSIGRHDRADPKWLVPLICRRGGVTKRDIGAIRIAERETLFEISTATASRFAQCVSAADDDEVRIEAAGAPAVQRRTAKHRP